MTAAAHKLGLELGLLVTVVLVVSCASNHQYQTAIYGEPGSDKILICVGGPNVKNKGIYYLPMGATLESALLASGIEHDQFVRTLMVSRFENGKKSGKRYNVHKLSDGEKAEVLHNKDILFFPCTYP